jgi:hypothetical protein
VLNDRENFLMNNFLPKAHTEAHQSFQRLQPNSLILVVQVMDAELKQIVYVVVVEKLAEFYQVAKHRYQRVRISIFAAEILN